MLMRDGAMKRWGEGTTHQRGHIHQSGAVLPMPPERHENVPPLLKLYEGNDDFGAQGLMRPSAAILDGEMEHQNGEIEHHMEHQNEEMEHQNGKMEHQNEEMEHQNGEMDLFGYTPGCKRLIQPPGCNSTTTRMLSEVLISYTARFLGNFNFNLVYSFFLGNFKL